jgi:hypothetical protein
MRESVNAWLWDHGGRIGMPRIGVEALADQWDTHDIQVNLAFADGRVVAASGPGPVHDALGADGTPRILGAGPLSFELVEPFEHWRLHLDGTATETSTGEQIAGWLPGGEGPEVAVALELDLRSVAPPYEPGTLLPEAAEVLATQEEGAMMGGPRFEQLVRATGWLRVGDEQHEIDGAGLRIRRRGVRQLAAFRGHVWQSAVFPDGRAFGFIVYPPRTDGKPTFNEGFVFEGSGTLIPARVVQAPWLDGLQPSGQDVSVVLETSSGATTIRGETLLSTFMVLGALEGFKLQQAVCRYEWDGQVALGMLERSSPG